MNIISNLAIILCTYNSTKFLTEQLMSFDAQSFSDWSLFVYDDGSTDNTESLIKAHQKSDTIHHINLIGNSSFMARLVRMKKLFNGFFREWNDKNVKALKQNISLFTAENRNKLNLFDGARNKGLFTSLVALKKAGIHRLLI
jgi:cellulose synthase/poly-beta-1,6-N-acetylglucosamine synthase-like glycosyltransferase